MIITRHRKRRRHLGRILIPLAILAVGGFLIGFPPTARIIAHSPLRPVWVGGSNLAAAVSRPLSFAGQQATLADRNREIRDLNARLDAQRAAKADADARIAQLQRQLAATNDVPAASPAPVVRPKPAPATVPGSDGGTTVADRRTAATWAAMEPEKAAALVQRLPDDQVVRVLAQMDTDGAAAILGALPPATAARLTRAEAQVATASGR